MEKDKCYKIKKTNEFLYFKVNSITDDGILFTGNCLSILENNSEDFELYSNFDISPEDQGILLIEEIDHEEYKNLIMEYAVKLM